MDNMNNQKSYPETHIRTNLALTADIVAAHAGSVSLSSDELTNVIRSVFATLEELDGKSKKISGSQNSGSADQSVVVCRECGRSFRILKRHLKESHGLTVAEYKERWGITSDHLLVSVEYSLNRSRLARANGLGTGENSRWNRRKESKASE
jgi:predicted transcriptional regulator